MDKTINPLLLIDPIVNRCTNLSTPDYYQHHHHIAKYSLQKMMASTNHTEIDNSITNPISLPYLSFSKREEVPHEISFYSLSHYREDSYKFFFDMITRWLLPGKRLNIVLLNAVDMQIPQLVSGILTLCEVVVKCDNIQEAEIVQRNWSSVKKQLKLGLESDFYARRILEIKGFSSDEKNSIVLHELSFLMKRIPQIFDQSLLPEMQYFLVACSDEFKSKRTCRHMSRLVAIQHYFRQLLRSSIKKSPHKRHLKFKLFRINTLSENPSSQKVIGLIVGVNLIREKERFEKRHILKAVQAYIPNAKIVEDSFLTNRQGHEHMCMLYCELEKGESHPFTDQEIRLLRKELPRALESRIEHMMHPVFMPRNEEDIYRNILMLGTQIKYLRDIPQMTISFDEQSHRHLFFTVIVVRVLKTNDKNIQDLFQKTPSEIEYIHDRSQYVGSLRRKHKKEATVFRVKMQKDAFLRSDFTIDLNKARQVVVNELSRIIGDVRDFNGGMIAKQNEVLKQLQGILQKEKGYNELLLENFFYSLTPVIARSVFDLDLLKTLYLRLIEAVDDTADFDESYSLKITTTEKTVYVLIKTKDRKLKDELAKALTHLKTHSSQLASMYLSDFDLIYLGYIYRQHDESEQRRFSSSLERALASWKLKKQANNYFGSRKQT